MTRRRAAKKRSQQPDCDPWYFTYEDDPPPTDEQLAYELICGVEVLGPRGQFVRQYLEPGSYHERRARAALARFIRKGTQFPNHMREVLAALFDPASSKHVERQIVFKFRKGNRPRPHQYAGLLIAQHVWDQQVQGIKKEAAVASAMERFGLKRRRVLAICRDCALPAVDNFVKKKRRRK
jgi:hypothetical protein